MHKIKNKFSSNNAKGTKNKVKYHLSPPTKGGTLLLYW